MSDESDAVVVVTPSRNLLEVSDDMRTAISQFNKLSEQATLAVGAKETKRQEILQLEAEYRAAKANFDAEIAGAIAAV